jgi:Putative GTPases (G3E family)
MSAASIWRRAIEVDPTFMEPEYPFEWGGIFDLPAGGAMIELSQGPDPAMSLVVLPLPPNDGEEEASIQLPLAAEKATIAFSGVERAVAPGGSLQPDGTRWHIKLDQPPLTFSLDAARGGRVAIFTEHHPNEFAMHLTANGRRLQPLADHAYKPDHEHDEEVTSVGIEVAGEVDGEKLNAWLSNLLATKGVDIYRMKGVLAIYWGPRRYVFQGVHMLLDHQPDRPWGSARRENRMIFIGRQLDRKSLTEGFCRCLV